tara:strand:+ start:1745 stop:3514 length:1770 start_codon:yes stop_codon:yes gene_type:complete
MSVLEKLTEGIVRRDVSKEGQALLEKWEKTGLLEGITNEQNRNGMAVLLENQAKELLREASTMSAGDVEGFASVAFPIVRRVFGGLIANDIVSVQPMSLPSGLIFFLDFTHEESRSGMAAGESIYGGNKVAKGILDGVDLDESFDQGGPGGFYDLGTAYSSPTGSNAAIVQGLSNVVTSKTGANLTAADKKNLRFDPDLLAHLDATAAAQVRVVKISAAKVTEDLPNLNENALTALTIAMDGDAALDDAAVLVRRLTRKDTDGGILLTLLLDTGDPGDLVTAGHIDASAVKYPLNDTIGVGSSVGSVLAGEFPLEGAGHINGNDPVAQLRSGRIPEIDIKVDSIAVTAITKKLKAKWTPELGQDLNAYHNLDAEVELTGILSEQIALEIDQEILGDLIQGAKAGTRYWSRAPGLFVDSTGAELGAAAAAPDFTGTVSEWYETLIETINDVSAQIHRKTLRGGANFVVCSPEVANILEFTSGFRASVTADSDRGDIGAVKTGSLSKKFDVMVDPYFPRNVVLVGRRGNSFLESGYVYAPYVPLQVTPTIFGTEDFVPRKGVMTRYAKQMVRPDMYGLVIVRGLLGEEGSS